MQQGGLQVLYVIAHFCQCPHSHCLNRRHTWCWHRARFWCKPTTYRQYVALLFDERYTDYVGTGGGTSGAASLRSTSIGVISASLLLSFVVGAVMLC